jgi:hypothetical protein
MVTYLYFYLYYVCALASFCFFDTQSESSCQKNKTLGHDDNESHYLRGLGSVDEFEKIHS